MTRLTVIFDRFDLIRVPFPFTDRVAVKHRPALVLSDAVQFNAPVGHYVLAMITSLGTPAWPLDCVIEKYADAGLPHPSKVRFKIFTLDQRIVRGYLGHLSSDDEARVKLGLAKCFP